MLLGSWVLHLKLGPEEFSLVKDLAMDAIRSGEECITDDAVANWSPLWSRYAPVQRRLEQAGV